MGQHAIFLPVKITKAEGATMVRSVDPETIKKVVYAILPKKRKGAKE